MQQIFPWPRPFPPPTRRALPASSPASRVLRPRPTPRSSSRRIVVLLLPAAACPVLAARRFRGLPIPAQKAYVNLPNSRTPDGRDAPRPLLGALAWSVPGARGADTIVLEYFGAQSPGLFTHPPTLRTTDRSAARKDWASRGRTPPGVGLPRFAVACSSRSPTSSCRFSSAHTAPVSVSARVSVSTPSRPGRDGPFGPPPGQNPASGFPAPGSHLGSTGIEPNCGSLPDLTALS